METTLRSPLIARIWRGHLVESEHRGSWCIVSRNSVVHSGGDQTRPQFLRSAAKPFQAIAALRRIEERGFQLTQPEVAIMAASHSGQDLHVSILRNLLARAGISERELQCGTHPPYHGATARELLRKGESPTVLHHNCSGKHTAMLLSAKLSGEDLASYLDPSHPVQRRNRACLAEFAGCAVDEVGVEVDGCSAPTFTLTLPHAARAFGSLVDGSRQESALTSLRTAVAAEPIAYCGEGKSCTKFICATGGGVFPKAGAEGFYGVGIASAGLGVAIKVEDGSSRPVEPWIASILLRHLEDLTEEGRDSLRSMTKVDVANARGAVVGRLEIVA